MSFDALSWAAKCKPGSAPQKLVLLALAECAQRGTNLAFPSIAALVEFSSLNRKTVIAALASLEESGLIEDTQERVGRTKQVKVYYLNLESVPKTEPSQKRNSSTFTPKGSQKRDTEPVMEPVSPNGDSARAKKANPFPKPEWADAQVWSDFLDNRKAKRLKNTATAYKGFLEDVERHRNAQWTPAALLEHATRKGWGGIYSPNGRDAKPAANDAGGFLAHKMRQRQARAGP